MQAYLGTRRIVEKVAIVIFGRTFHFMIMLRIIKTKKILNFTNFPLYNSTIFQTSKLQIHRDVVKQNAERSAFGTTDGQIWKR
jgi:hypothetical protein